MLLSRQQRQGRIQFWVSAAPASSGNLVSVPRSPRSPPAGADPKDFKYLRFGEFFDRTRRALTSIPFLFDITSQEYRSLWPPYTYEPWSAEEEIFHNPHSRYPIPDELLPEATHWRMVDGEVSCKAFYETSILRSRTLVLPKATPSPTFDQLFGAPDE